MAVPKMVITVLAVYVGIYRQAEDLWRRTTIISEGYEESEVDMFVDCRAIVDGLMQPRG